MKKNQYLVGKLQDLDDEAFAEVVEEISERSIKTERLPNDGLIHMLEMSHTLDDIRQNKGKFKGFSTGYTQLDSKMGGLEPGSVTLIAGETSNGKSALATNIAVKVAQTGVSVLYVSLEMTHSQMLERLDTISDSPLELPMMFQKSFNLDYKDLEPLIKKASKVGAKLVVLDYLQYLGRGMSQDEVARMSKTIKALALTYNVSFLVIVSLRKSDQKVRRRWYDMEIEELMGTAAIGYDADTAIVVSRKDTEDEYRNDAIFIKVLKTRNVRLDYHDRIVELRWNATRISEEWAALDNSAINHYAQEQELQAERKSSGQITYGPGESLPDIYAR